MLASVRILGQRSVPVINAPSLMLTVSLGKRGVSQWVGFPLIFLRKYAQFSCPKFRKCPSYSEICDYKNHILHYTKHVNVFVNGGI